MNTGGQRIFITQDWSEFESLEMSPVPQTRRTGVDRDNEPICEFSSLVIPIFFWFVPQYVGIGSSDTWDERGVEFLLCRHGELILRELDQGSGVSNNSSWRATLLPRLPRLEGSHIYPLRKKARRLHHHHISTSSAEGLRKEFKPGEERGCGNRSCCSRSLTSLITQTQYAASRDSSRHVPRPKVHIQKPRRLPPNRNVNKRSGLLLVTRATGI